MRNANVERCFERARAQAASGKLVVVRSGGLPLLLLPALSAASVNPDMVTEIEKLMPSTVKRSVAVIADTTWATVVKPTLQAAGRSIPFWGLLMGFACIGHSVWVFDGSASLVSAGCRGADVLIVDSASLTALPSDWRIEAAKVMRCLQILVHDRASYRLVPVTTPD